MLILNLDRGETVKIDDIEVTVTDVHDFQVQFDLHSQSGDKKSSVEHSSEENHCPTGHSTRRPRLVSLRPLF